MSNNIDSFWVSTAKANCTSIIIPDGCRDLIMKQKKGQKPDWFISPLFNQSKFLQVNEDVDFVGFRIKPGTIIDEEKLLQSIQQNEFHQADIENVINDFTARQRSIEEALKCLSSDDTHSVLDASLRLGVSIRTLQRLVSRNTSRTPSFWFQLARVKRAGKAIATSNNFIEVAYDYGFSDHAHMCREFKRWFNLSPSEIDSHPDIKRQLQTTGFT